MWTSFVHVGAILVIALGEYKIRPLYIERVASLVLLLLQFAPGRRGKERKVNLFRP